MKLDLIGIGEAMIELYAAEKLGVSRTLQKSYGGDVLNSLVHASRLGFTTGFITRVGNDPFGAALRQTWQTEGVDISQAPLVDGENGVYLISLLEDGEREFTYRRANSAASQLQPQDLESAYIRQSQMLLLSGITQAISSSAEATTLAAAQIAKQHGVQVVFDPNYRPKLWAARGGLPSAQAAARQLLPLVDILLPSSPTDLDVFAVPHSQALFDLAAVVAVKNGADGALVRHDQQIMAVPSVQGIVVDTTGAGDAWNAGFITQILQHKNTLQAAQFANALAAEKIKYRGAIPQ